MAETMIGDFLKSGHSVHLVQSHRKGINPDVPESLTQYVKFSCDTIPRKVVDKSHFVKRYRNDVHYAFTAMKHWIKVKDQDVIYLQSNPTITYHLILLKLFQRCPIVYSIYDVFPGHAYDIGVIKSKLIYKILQFLQKPSYTLADAITVLSKDMKEKVVEQGAPANKVYVVPAWFDVNTAREIPRDKNRFIKKYNIPEDRFYVQFAGSIGYVFNYRTVIEVAKRIQKEKNINIQIIGDGPVKQKFVEEAKKLELNNIIFYPLQPVELVPDVYSACDLCMIPLKRGVIGNGVPSKAPILMACHRVILNSVETNSSYAKMFIENNMGLSFDILDYDGMANAIIELSHKPEEIHYMADNAYQYGMKNYSSTRSIKKLMRILEKTKR